MHIFIGGETPTEIYLDANAVLDVPAPYVNGLTLFHATTGEGYRRGGSRRRGSGGCRGRCGWGGIGYGNGLSVQDYIAIGGFQPDVGAPGRARRNGDRRRGREPF